MSRASCMGRGAAGKMRSWVYADRMRHASCRLAEYVADG